MQARIASFGYRAAVVATALISPAATLGAPQDPPSAPVTVVNKPANPVPVTGNVGVSGAVTIGNTPNVNVTNLPLVQNVDEPGRNPYQETQFVICGGPQNCNFTFAVVPPDKRLVLKHVSGFVDVTGGTIPNSNVQSSFGGNQFATVFFVGTRGTVFTNGTRIVYNSDVLAYFGPGEQPSGFYGLFSTSDTFLSGGSLTLSGYYVDLP